MVNLETAITTGGIPQDKAFHFRAPASALTALRDAGVDVATMANNHAADYGAPGLSDTLAAIAASHFPVIGIGADDAQAFAAFNRTIDGTRIAIIAADQVQDETTLRLFSAGPGKPGVANAYSPELLDAVRAARAQGYLVIVYLHWGTEHTTCPNEDQRTLTDQLAAAGATAVVGTHAHELQGAGWRRDGVFVAYGLGNYLWFKGAGDDSPDNGVLTLTFRGGKVVGDSFAPAHLDERGVPVPATGPTRTRIEGEWQAARECAGLSATRPG
jgi:poly-gamma-glutamate synthesis protein (capsule biosynthesis protein)